MNKRTTGAALEIAIRRLSKTLIWLRIEALAFISVSAMMRISGEASSSPQ